MHEKHWREKIALQAARLMCDAAALGYEPARQEAMRILGCGQLASQQLPTKQEIREKLAILGQDQQSGLRQRLLWELVTTMRALRDFHPRIDAEVLTVAVTPETEFEIEIDAAPAESVFQLLPEAMRVSRTEDGTSALLEMSPLSDRVIHLAGAFFLRVRMVSDRLSDSLADTKERIGLQELESELDGRETQSVVRPIKTTASGTDRFVHYVALLCPLEEVILPSERHPEGDALYHSLQVFQLALDERPYDEEFLLAALLHDVGKAIDPKDHVCAGLAALADHVSERTALLIEQHHQGHHYLDCTLGMRARRRLEADPNFEELLLLAECDKKGRQQGVAVPDVEQAIEEIRRISDEFSD